MRRQDDTSYHLHLQVPYITSCLDTAGHHAIHLCNGCLGESHAAVTSTDLHVHCTVCSERLKGRDFTVVVTMAEVEADGRGRWQMANGKMALGDCGDHFCTLYDQDECGLG